MKKKQPQNQRQQFMYYANRSSAATGSSKKPFLQRTWVRNLPSIIMLIALTASVLYTLGLSSNPRVIIAGQAPGQSTAGVRPLQTYQAGAQQILNSSIANKTKFTIDTAAFDKAFKAEFPEVSDVSISLPLLGHRPVVSLAAAKPVLLLTSAGQVYVLDARGVVIMKAADLSAQDKKSLAVVHDKSGLSASVGKAVLPSEYISFIQVIQEQLAAKKLALSDITLPAAPRELDIKVAGQTYTVKFSLDMDARESAGTYLAAKQYLDSKHIHPASYIDARVPGRIYYK